MTNSTKTWRLLDTGHLTAWENMALDQILLESVSKGHSPPILRFLQFSSPAALVGYHQSVDLELRTQYCADHNIEINRRITGGGAIVFEPLHLGWELIGTWDDQFVRKQNLFDYLCKPIVDVLNQMGLPARFRSRNDVEIDGKKVSGTGGTESGNAFLFQGTLLTDLDIPRMLMALRIPVHKLEDKEINSFRDRVTTLKRELGYLPEIPKIKTDLANAFSDLMQKNFSPSSLTENELQSLAKKSPYFASDQWIHKVRMPKNKRFIAKSTYKTKGGIIRAALVIDQRNHQIQSCHIHGDFFAYPQRLVNDLESLMKNCLASPEHIQRKLTQFFSNSQYITPDVSCRDFTIAITEALRKTDLMTFGFTMEECNNIFVINSTFEEIRSKNTPVLLIPYCAKLTGCTMRYRRECTMCKKCSVGDAVSIGKNLNLNVISILSFEDLMMHLNWMRKQSIQSYIGCCCEPFFTKHRKDFENSLVPGILINVESNTCYDLDQLETAYQGNFEGQTHLNIPLLQKVLDAVL